MSKEFEFEFKNYANIVNKDLTNLMELLKKQSKDNKPILYLGKTETKVILPYEEYKKMNNRLEQIDNANPSEALECLEKHKNMLIENNGDFIAFECLKVYQVCKQALLKQQEQEKVTEIIKEYQVDMWLLKQCDYENYIRIRKKAMVSVGQVINENGIILESEITEEEFDLVKRWVE